VTAAALRPRRSQTREQIALIRSPVHRSSHALDVLHLNLYGSALRTKRGDLFHVIRADFPQEPAGIPGLFLQKHVELV